ncbi:transglycosylase domain-containing protein [Streptomyces sp. NPDC002073]
MSDESPKQGWTPRDPDQPAASATPAGPQPAPQPEPPTGPQPAPQPGPQPNPQPAPQPGPQTKQQQKQLQRQQKQQKKAMKKQKRKRTGWRRILPTWRMLLGTFLLLALLLGGALVAGYMLVKIPAANEAATAQSNVYLYADGSPLARDGEVNRVSVPLAQVPLNIQQAVLAAEDRDFHKEPAVDPKAMVRAAWNTLTGKGKQSGSTITQQYVKNYYLGQEQTVERKVKEFFIAIKLGREKSKQHILEGYLNTSYFGRNAYGIQAAAQAYYGKDVSKLTTAEGAYLATLLNSPSTYDVVAHPQSRDRALGRWNYVLNGMVTKKWLDPAERAATKFPEPGKVRTPAGMSGQRGYLVEAVKDYLTGNKIIDEKTLAAGGYKITTTIDKKRQKDFVEAVREEVTSELDPKQNKKDRVVRVGGASIDPKTGKVVALYGGIDYTKQYVNNATRRDYQVGSTFKPLVFAAAVQNTSHTQDGRVIAPNTIYSGENERAVTGWDGEHYAPENEDQVNYGNITVRKATELSVNSVYAQMAVDVGADKIKETAYALGIPKDTPNIGDGPAMALGTATASVLDMTQAYATLAAHGEYTAYTLVAKISKNGSQVQLPQQESRRAISREAADTTTSMLVSTVESGTARAALASDHPAAGKTGTGEKDKSALFAAYTPDLATVVSIMGQDPDTGSHEELYGALGEGRINGGGYPGRVWAAYTKSALEGSDPVEFDLETMPGTYQPPPVETPSIPPSDTDGGTTDGGRTQGNDNGGKTNGGNTNGGNTNGGNTNGGNTNGGGNTTGGTNTGGNTTGGTDTGGNTTGGNTTGGGDTTGGNTTGGGTTTGGTDGGGTTGGADGGTDGGTTGGPDPAG